MEVGTSILYLLVMCVQGFALEWTRQTCERGAKGDAGEPGEGAEGTMVLILEDVSALDVVDLEEGSLVYTRRSGELWFRTPGGWRQVLLGRQL